MTDIATYKAVCLSEVSWQSLMISHSTYICDLACFRNLLFIKTFLHWQGQNSIDKVHPSSSYTEFILLPEEIKIYTI